MSAALALLVLLQATMVRIPTRLEWLQPIWSTETLADVQTLLAVDGAAPQPIARSCVMPAEPAGYRCTLALPPLTPGAHTLTVIARTVAAGIVTDEAASVTLVVIPSTELKP